MGKIAMFPGTVEVSEAPAPEIDLDALLDQQSDLLLRWRLLGEELHRRVYDIPFDIRFEIDVLLRESGA
jgi:hypothetical protein